MSTESKVTKLADELKIRVNPHYDHDVNPDENEFQYWNPVSATNDLIKLANSTLDIAQRVSDSMRRKTRIKADKRELQAQMDSIERELLVKVPLTASEAKSLKLISAAVERRAVEEKRAEELDELREQIAQLELDELEEETTISNGKMWLEVSKQMSENIKNALSFYKEERRREEGVR